LPEFSRSKACTVSQPCVVYKCRRPRRCRWA
jgi:hypothetical protein